jgi:GT2 family glycosyltransferase
MAEQPSVWVVTPVHNGIEHTVKFLASLEAQDWPGLRVIIVDDGSTDGTARRIDAEFPKTVVLTGDGNLWWSGATNLGVEHALKNGADYVLTVNNDVEIDPQAVSRLVAEAQGRGGQALVGSVIYDEADRSRVWYAGGTFNPALGELAHIRRVEPVAAMKSEWLTGMGVLVPAAAYSKVGFYDSKRFPQYFGDADFSLRAGRAGYDLVVATGSQIFTDTQSAWINKDFKRKPWGFVWQLYFSVRSQYYVPARVGFYWRYWPGNPAAALLKLYWGVFRSYAAPFVGSKVKRGLKKMRGAKHGRV